MKKTTLDHLRVDGVLDIISTPGCSPVLICAPDEPNEFEGFEDDMEKIIQYSVLNPSLAKDWPANGKLMQRRLHAIRYWRKRWSMKDFEVLYSKLSPSDPFKYNQAITETIDLPLVMPNDSLLGKRQKTFNGDAYAFRLYVRKCISFVHEMMKCRYRNLQQRTKELMKKRGQKIQEIDYSNSSDPLEIALKPDDNKRGDITFEIV